MIVVVGQPLFRATDDGAFADGLPARIALAAAARGRSVQLVGKAGEDPEGDAVILALAEGGVGHVAIARDAGNPTRRATGAEDDLADETATAVDVRGTVNESGIPVAHVSSLEPSDVDLALRYLTEYAVVVLADPAEADVVKVVADAARWVGARLILIMPLSQPLPDDLPADAIVFEAQDGDADGAFASMVASFAAALEEGDEPGEAFRSAIEADGWAVVTG